MSKLKNRTHIGTTIKNEYNKKLETLHQKTDIPKSKLHDQALELLFQKYSDILQD